MRLLPLLGFLLLPFAAAADFDDNPKITIAALLTSQGDMAFLKKPNDRRFDGATASKSRVAFGGQIRAIPKEKKKYLDQYFVGARHQPEAAALFTDEILVREEKQEYWLPIQTPVLAYFRKEVKAGEPVDLNLVLLVSFVAKGGDIVHVMGVNEFAVLSTSK